jgi:hypothetical protein
MTVDIFAAVLCKPALSLSSSQIGIAQSLR